MHSHCAPSGIAINGHVLFELVNKGLLYGEFRGAEDSCSDIGWTRRHTYTPIGSFSKVERKKASASRRPRQDDILDLDEIEDAP